MKLCEGVGSAVSHALRLPGVRVGHVLRLKAAGEFRPGSAVVEKVDGDMVFIGTPLNCLIPAAAHDDEIVVVGRKAEPGEVLAAIARRDFSPPARWEWMSRSDKEEFAALERAMQTGILEDSR